MGSRGCVGSGIEGENGTGYGHACTASHPGSSVFKLVWLSSTVCQVVMDF